jgi:hypothetical protein
MESNIRGSTWSGSIYTLKQGAEILVPFLFFNIDKAPEEKEDAPFR